jgi:SAM-dependent methyltransferase
MKELARSTSQGFGKGPAADATPLRVAFPKPQARLEQDDEWCVARVDGEWREIRFHDYGRVYEIPGLYEYIFRDLLKCGSPKIVRSLLEGEIQSSRSDASPLRVLDLGAGNGLMAEELAEMEAELVVGVDIIPEAAKAADRDRPGMYEKYFVLDMTRVAEGERRELSRYHFNCLTCVAALGFGDIPTLAFSEAYNLIAPGGWVAFNIKEQFLGNGDHSGFARLIEQMASKGVLSIRRRRRYPHRLAVNGEPIHYVAVAGKKVRDIELPLSCLGG